MAKMTIVMVESARAYWASPARLVAWVSAKPVPLSANLADKFVRLSQNLSAKKQTAKTMIVTDK
jgi:hypothetical protein